MVDPVVGALTDPFDNIHMGITAENLAERTAISRERQDAFAVESHRRAARRPRAGKFEDEIVPVEVKVKREKVDVQLRTSTSATDASTRRRWRSCKPVFKATTAPSPPATPPA